MTNSERSVSTPTPALKKEVLTDEELLELGRAIHSESMLEITEVFLYGLLSYELYPAIEAGLSTRFRSRTKSSTSSKNIL